MKRKFTILFSGILITSVLAGCNSPFSKSEQNLNTETTSDFNINENSPENKAVFCVPKLPRQYFITYEITDEKGIISTISKAVDSEGNIYYKNTEEYLFINNGNDYILYKPVNGKFEPCANEKYGLNYIDELTKEFNTYTDKLNFLNMSAIKYIGESVISDRPCDIYSVSVGFINFKQQYTYAIDKETFACLSCESKKDISGSKLSGGENFLCVRFNTNNINLINEFLT